MTILNEMDMVHDTNLYMAGVETVETNRARLFIVEDESIIALNLQFTLVELGYEVVGSTNSGEKAIHQVSVTEPDMILMDIRLKGQMNGIQAARTIRELYDIPSIFITAHADTDILEEVKSVDPMGFIIKPFSAKDLRKTIELGLHKYRAEMANQEKIRLLKVLQDTAAALNSSLSLDEVLTAILDNVSNVLSSTLSLLLMIRNGEARIMQTRGCDHKTPKEKLDDYRLKISNIPQLQQIVESQQPRIISSLAEIEGLPQEFWHDGITHSCIAAPITIDCHVMGLIVLIRREPDTFHPADTASVQAFANQAAVAIHNAQMYHQLSSQNLVLQKQVAERTEQLVKAKKRVETIIDSSTDAIILLDETGDIRGSNTAFQLEFGYSSDQVYRRPARLLVRPTDENALLEALQALTENSTPRRLYLQAARADGTCFDADVALSPLSTTDNGVSIVSSWRDISELKEAQRMKDEFVSNVTHELRTPITSMKLMLQLIEMIPYKIPHYISRLERETNRLHKIIEDLLRLSRIDQRGVVLDCKMVDLNSIVQQLVDDRILLARERQLTIHFDPSPELPPVEVDPGLIVQTVSILLTNAFNYSPENGTITISTQHKDNMSNPGVTIRVADTGPGIHPDELPHLFERFYRGQAARQNNVAGTGLGLTLAWEIVTRHGGEIKAYSTQETGGGAVFEVRLPQHADSG